MRFSISSLLPKRNAILKSKNNKRRLASVLSTFDAEEDATMDSPDDSAYGHDEADITLISYVLESANNGKGVIRVLSDDTDVIVLLVYCVHRADLQCKVQMEQWDGTILDINATSAHLGSKCLQLLGMHALSGCDTTSVHLTHYCLGTFQLWLMCWVKWAHHWRVSWMAQSPFLVLCMVSCRKHLWSLIASHSSQGKLKVPKSWPYLQNPQI